MSTITKIEGGKRMRGVVRKSEPGHPLITVATVVLNNKKSIEETMQSVLNQTYSNVEYVVIDGGSTDGTLDIIKKYEDKLDYWISEPDKGLCDAMNKAVGYARGDWVHLLNSDDHYVDAQVLEKVALVLKDPEKCFYYFTMYFEELDGSRSVQKFNHRWWNHWLLYYSMYTPHPTMFIAKTQYQKLGLYDAKFPIAFDQEMVLRLCDAGFTPVFTDFPVTVMRAGGYSSKNQTKTFNDFKEATIKHGLPRWFATALFYFKIWKYRLLHPQK